MAGRTLAIAGAAIAAIGIGIGLRRGLRALDEADADTAELTDESFTFPSGERIAVTTSDGGTIVTETAGAGDVTVLVHGLTSSRQDLGPVARQLVDRGRTVVGVDQRGHGDSTPGSAGYSPARLGCDLAEVLVGLDLRDVVLVGHSMGGIAAMTFAIEHPQVCAERVSGLVLVATTPRAPRMFRKPRPKLIERSLGQAGVDAAVLRPGTALALFGRFGSTRLVRAALASGQRAHPTAVARCAAGLIGYDLTHRLGSVAAPARCIYGTWDLVTPARANRFIVEAIPGATVEEIDGAGHLLIWTHVAEVADQVTAIDHRSSIKPG